MENYEVVREMIDYIFNEDILRYNNDNDVSLSNYISKSNIVGRYDTSEYIEERIWIGEDFLIVRAGQDMKTCLVSPNPNPDKMSNLIKMDDIAVPGEYWSMGEPYIMRYQQIEENRIHNDVLDLIGLCVAGVTGIVPNYLEDPTDTEMYPGRTFKLKAIPGIKISDAIQNFQASPIGVNPALSFLSEVKGIGQQTTSITDFVTGASKSIADSATEARQLGGASDLAIVDKIREMVSGAMTELACIQYSQYPIVYKGQKIKMASSGQSIYFTGKTKEEISEKELKGILKEFKDANNIVFLDDLSVSNPKFKVIGDIEVSKDYKIRQWTQAIDFANNVNKQAFESGDRRRIDVIQMSLDAMENFDVISDPSEYMMENQPTKSDQIKESAMAGAQANIAMQQQNGGRPSENNVNVAPAGEQAVRSEAQPMQ